MDPTAVALPLRYVGPAADACDAVPPGCPTATGPHLPLQPGSGSACRLAGPHLCTGLHCGATTLRTQEEETQDKDEGMENQGRGNGQLRKRQRRTKMSEWRTKEEGTQNKDERMENPEEGTKNPRQRECITEKEGLQSPV